MDEYEKKVSEAKNTLGTIMTAINQENLTLEGKKKENADMDIEVVKAKEEMRMAKEETARFAEEKVIAHEELLGVQNEVAKEKSLLAEVKNKREEAEKSFETFVSKTNDEMAQMNSEKTIYAKKIATDNEALDKTSKEKEEKITELDDKILSKETALKSLVSQEGEMLTRIDAIKAVTDDFLVGSEQAESELRSVKNDVMDQKTEIEKGKVKLDALRVEIAGMEAKKESLELDIKKHEDTRADYVQAKMVLQADKEELTNRELNIMYKYEQAGLPYDKDSFTPSTKSTLAEKADLQQLKEDLDKREAFIKNKFKEAGINYI